MPALNRAVFIPKTHKLNEKSCKLKIFLYITRNIQVHTMNNKITPNKSYQIAQQDMQKSIRLRKSANQDIAIGIVASLSAMAAYLGAATISRPGEINAKFALNTLAVLCQIISIYKLYQSMHKSNQALRTMQHAIQDMQKTKNI